ncbi:MAG: CHASE4 domain-containing protein [Methanosarcina sp.]
MNTEQGYLDYLVRDWACWNDTYRFIDDRNQKFIDVNVQNETLAGLRINAMLFVDNSGSVVYAKAIDINTEEEVPVPEELFEMVKNGTLLSKNESDIISGFILLNKAPTFVACHPILTTKYKGPPEGTLIFVRYFDEDLLGSFKEATRSSLTMYRVDRKIPEEVREKLKDFSKAPGKPVIEPLSEKRIAGYFELRDISNKPALIIRADFPRDLYKHGKETLTYMYLFLLLTGLMTGAGVKFALDRLFISRLVKIDDFVTKVRSEKDLSKRLPLEDNDELYRLSREINGMLNEINLAEQELKEQEREKKILLDSLNELVIFINPEFKILWANKAALGHMKMDLKQVVGLELSTLPAMNSPFSQYPQLEQIFKTGSKKSGEFTAKDGRVWFIQATPVTNQEGKIIGVLETCRDITEKKKIEQLQKKEINHRIKNNLQIISSLLDLQAEKFNDKKVIEAFKESENRIQSMSLIHQELYESGKLDCLDFSSYLHKLIGDLLKSYNTEQSKIRVKLNVSSVFLAVDTAVSLGIIVNELFTNSIKYAFPAGTGGEICISLTKEKIEETGDRKEVSRLISSESENLFETSQTNQLNEYYKLVFADSGKGIPEEIDFRNTKSLGLQLVNALVGQLDGHIELKRDHGTKFEIWFRDIGK